jgi:DNA-binding transcriptional regulator YhcF (GntR family)
VALNIAIDPTSSVAPFEQLRSALVEAIGRGELAAGTRLPTVRGLAESLGVAAGTVARAYRELEASARVVATQREIQRAATVFAEHVRRLRVEPDSAIAMVTAALGAATDVPREARQS